MNVIKCRFSVVILPNGAAIWDEYEKTYIITKMSSPQNAKLTTKVLNYDYHITKAIQLNHLIEFTD